MQVKGIRKLFAFPGNVVEEIKIHPEMVTVRLRWDKRYKLRCPECGTKMAKHKRSRRSVRDLPMGTAKYVHLNIEVIQGKCSACGSCCTFLPEGISNGVKATWRFQLYVSGLARFMPISSVAETARISASSAWRWDKRVLEMTLPPPDLDKVSVLLVDEKAVRKRHGYVTLVMNGENGELLFMHEGRKKESLKAFFDLMNEDRKRHVKAVAMDRLGSYYEVVREEVPRADIVFDKFHLIANFNGVVDEVRRAEWHKASKEDKAFIKGQRYNLYRPWDTHPTDKQKYSLAILLGLNENLRTVYVLKEALAVVWTYRHRGYARRYLEEWLDWAMESGLEPVKRFARTLKKHIPEVLNYCKHQITTGPLEGFNNTVSRLIHRANGFKNMEYLYLKLRQESLA